MAAPLIAHAYFAHTYFGHAYTAHTFAHTYLAHTFIDGLPVGSGSAAAFEAPVAGARPALLP